MSLFDDLILLKSMSRDCHRIQIID